MVLFDGGEIIGKGCLDIGGRLIRLGPDLTVEQVSPAGGQRGGGGGCDCGARAAGPSCRSCGG